jgi:hypothetical protein
MCLFPWVCRASPPAPCSPTPVPVEVRLRPGFRRIRSGLDPDSIRSVDPDPYSEDEGVRVCAPGCAGRHLRLHVHPCSRRGKDCPWSWPGFWGIRIRARIQSGQWIRIRIRKMKAYVFVPLGVPGATSGSMFTPVPVEVRLRMVLGFRIRIRTGSGSVFGR